MNMGADFLASLRRSEHPDNRDPGLFTQLRWPHIISKRGVIFGWDGLVVVNAVQPHAENVHDGLYMVARSAVGAK